MTFGKCELQKPVVASTPGPVARDSSSANPVSRPLQLLWLMVVLVVSIL